MVKNVTKSELNAAVSDRKKDMAILESKLSMEIEVMKQEISQIKEQNEKDHKLLNKNICEIKDMVGDALEKKADKDEVDEIKKQIFWAITAAIGLLMTILGYLITSHIN